jgi:hypothetical protein
MRKRGGLVLGGLLILALAGCSQYFEAGGSKASLSVDIEFVDADRNPIPNAPVYVVETVGTMHVVTEVLQTDAHGHIQLNGNRCLPAIVAVRGGSVVVQRETLAPFYQMTVKGGDQPPLDQLAGKPDGRFLNYSRTHTDCG